MYEIITNGIKQNYYEFCENQIRLYYRSVSKGQATSNLDISQILNLKLDDLISGINKINDSFDKSNKDTKNEIISELKSVSKTIKDLDK